MKLHWHRQPSEVRVFFLYSGFPTQIVWFDCLFKFVWKILFHFSLFPFCFSVLHYFHSNLIQSIEKEVTAPSLMKIKERGLFNGLRKFHSPSRIKTSNKRYFQTDNIKKFTKMKSQEIMRLNVYQTKLIV